MSDPDAILAQLSDAHHRLVDAGSAYLAGDAARAADQLDVVVFTLRDAAADLRRLDGADTAALS